MYFSALSWNIYPCSSQNHIKNIGNQILKSQVSYITDIICTSKIKKWFNIVHRNDILWKILPTQWCMYNPFVWGAGNLTDIWISSVSMSDTKGQFEVLCFVQWPMYLQTIRTATTIDTPLPIIHVTRWNIQRSHHKCRTQRSLYPAVIMGHVIYRPLLGIGKIPTLLNIFSSPQRKSMQCIQHLCICTTFSSITQIRYYYALSDYMTFLLIKG